MWKLRLCMLVRYLQCYLVLFLTTQAFCSTSASLYCQEESRLHNDLLNDTYDSRKPPGNCSGEPIDIEISMTLQDIVKLDENDEIFTASSWIRLNWLDERLVWDPEDYGDLEFIPTDASAVWTPILILENTVVGSFEDIISKRVNQATLASDGNVFLDFPLLHATSCKIAIAYFPFDVQNCLVQFSAERVPNTYITLRAGDITGDIGAIFKQWELQKLTGRSYTATEGKIRSFDVVEFDVQLNRLSAYHLSTTAAPVLILTLLGIVIFLIPPGSGERLSAGISVLLGLTFFELLVCDALPVSTSPPILGIYWLGSFLFVTLSVLLSLISVNLHNCGENIKGQFKRRLLLEILPRLCCTLDDDTTRVPTSNNDIAANVVFENVAATNKFSISDNEDSAIESANAVTLRTFHQGSDLAKEDSQYEARGRYSSASQVACSKVEASSDYQTATKTLDRFFLVVVTCAYIIFTLIVLTRRP
ncbi:neuronal acetylcholine receptor subunit alpha-10-like [Amphiura filiformis]|uniref:neuronal acetylcholine receptor subunit alpha-10-like n=1 Tax=Amphiura filiformis TaxID=82378 RepID=UPI003B210F0D